MAAHDIATARDRQREYWRNRDPKPVVRNPLLELLSRRATHASAPCAATHGWTLSDGVSQEILRVCNDSDLSLYILLVTMLKAVIARCTGETAVTILSLNYSPDGVVPKPGVVIFQDHVQLSEDLRSNILETRRTVVGAYSNQAITLTDIHGPQLAEEIARNHPLCVLSNIHSLDASLRSWPLELRFTRTEREISCSVAYDSARLHVDRVSEFCSNLQHFIEAASSDYAVPLEAVEWLSGERLKRISAFSKGRVVDTPDSTLHELFAEQARKMPGALALVHGAQTVTYAELSARAGVIARNLQEMGIEPGDTIALRLRSGIDAVATMLASMMAGASFAPISLSEPPNRLGRLLERCRPKLLVTIQGGPDVVPGVRTVEMSRLLARRDSVLAERAELPARSDAPAYVIFTSGTSGEPKCVVIEHRGIVNAIAWKAREYGFSPGHRVLPLFGYEFDGFVLNAFAPLCSGATVVLMDDDERRRPKHIAACIDSQRVTELVTAPLLYEAVLDHVTGDRLRSVQRVTLAGESANPETVTRSRRVGPHVQISNEYGPTESSVVSTYLAELSPDSVSVIGTPIDNVDVCILDARGKLVPAGVVGEIFIGGRGLAQGYVAGAAVAQESFVYVRGARLYRTGDLGCWLSDGSIEFCGRQERYVKLRGQRIDLEEIRAAILECTDVKDAVVLCVGDRTDGVLCACVVVDAQTSLAGIETFLRHELPSHMIPNRLIPLEALPLNAGGKVDVAALQTKLREAAAVEWGVLPSNDIERRLVAIWRSVLETERVGIDDNFFLLGGHSLRAVRLLTDIHEVFGVELRLNQIFSANTVRRLAEVIERHRREHPGARANPPDEDVPSEHPLSPAQERMLALTNEYRVSYNLPVLFSLDANVDVRRLQSALQAVLERHDSLRASFQLANDRWVQRFSDTLTVTIAEQALARDSNIEEAARSALTPFDLEKAPLFRVVLFTVEGRHAYLLFDFHHIIVDEVSLAIVLRELAMFYNGERVESASPHSYAACAKAQQRQRASEDYQAQLAAAAHKLRSSDLEPLRLPFDHPPTRRKSHNRGGLVRRNIPRKVIVGARQICADSEVTDFMFFMAVFGLLLNKYTHQSTMVIGAPVSVRSNVLTRDLVGLCLNTVPFKVTVPSGATFKEYLRGVAAGIIDDLGRSQVGFDDVVKALKIERHFGENPLFSVMLNVVDASVTRLPFKDVGTTYRPLHNGTSKFDLILELDLTEHSFGFEFPTERFLESTIGRLSDSLITLLEDVVAKPDAPLSALQVLNAAELQRLLEWSGGKHVGTYDEGSVVSLFERRVLERSSDIALVFGDDSLTYGDLNAKANKLAHKLRSLDCGENDVVAVLVERSPAAIVAIMAVQKAGAAHLPLDPFYPTLRTSKMLSDSGARVLITDQDVSALHFTGTVIGADADLSDFSSANVGLSPRPESVAYVLYTSGTTGGPKGVMVAQRNLVTLVNRATSQLSIGHRDVWTLFHSFCFDVSVWEMFGALLSGSRLVIVPREIAANPDRVLNLIEKNGVTVLCQPPSAFYLLADAMIRARRPTSVRYVVLGGEAIKTEEFKQWYRHYGDAH